jgi:hypothetical protein
MPFSAILRYIYRNIASGTVSSLLPPAHPTSLLAATASLPLIKRDRRTDIVLRPRAMSDAPCAVKRSKIWELSDCLHCSIIGACLSNAELRQVLVRVNATGAEAADDHELHVFGVMLAKHPEAGAKLLHRALDRRHGLSIKRYARAKDGEALRRLWDESIQSGDIPGGYWALLSHPVATEAVVKKAFRDVHMLSIRRTDDGVQGFDASREIATLRNVVAEVNRKLGQETARRERLEQRMNAISARLTMTQAALQTAEGDRDAFRRDVELIKDHLIELQADNGA